MVVCQGPGWGLRDEGGWGNCDYVNHVHERWWRVCDTLGEGEVSQFGIICGQKRQDWDEREVRVHIG